MNKISEMKRAIFFNESIEEITPMDMTGAPVDHKLEIYYLYAKYGKDPERVKLCEQKLKEVRDAAGRHCV